MQPWVILSKTALNVVANGLNIQLTRLVQLIIDYLSLLEVRSLGLKGSEWFPTQFNLGE